MPAFTAPEGLPDRWLGCRWLLMSMKEERPAKSHPVKVHDDGERRSRVVPRNHIDQRPGPILWLISHRETRLIELEGVVVHVELVDVRRISIRIIVRGRDVSVGGNAPGREQIGPAWS